MHSFQPYLHFRKTSSSVCQVQTLVAIPDGWIFHQTTEVVTHDVEGERLFFIMVQPESGNEIDGTFEVTFNIALDPGTNEKIIVEVVHLTGGSNHDVLGHFAGFIDDSSEGEEQDRTVGGGGKKVVTSSTQIIRDPV
ncbi:MAG: hypothetical protein AAFP02_05890 [Bacteroidota bacterium]